MKGESRISNRKVADYFDKRGEDYLSSWQSAAKKQLARLEADWIRKAIDLVEKSSSGRTIKTLDIGMGTGRISEEILKHKVEHYGTDISPIMVDYCRKKFKGNKKIKKLAVHNILNSLPANWREFDLVTAIRVLDYTPDWPKMIDNIYRRLKPGGTFLFTFRNQNSLISVSNRLVKQLLPATEETYGRISRVINGIGFSRCEFEGFAKLLDIFYDWSDGKYSVRILFFFEKVLRRIFGKTVGTRLFYITCEK